MSERGANLSLYRRIAAGAALLLAGHSLAGEVTVQVRDMDGDPVQHAVVYLLRSDGGAIPGTATTAIMAQRDSRFDPPVIAVPRDSKVTFSNQDNTRHHVYSFSEAKVFETKLYSSEEAPQIHFGKAGHVALGCNIHDWMAGHILVLDTPYFSLADATGTARLEGVPAGAYLLTAWHPGTPVRDLWKQNVVVEEQGTAALQLEVGLPITTPLEQKRKLSPLELKLRKATSGQ